MSYIVAIDGPAGSGKGTITKNVAERLNLINIDTGAMYRCVALKATQENIDVSEINKLEEMLRNNVHIELRRENNEQRVFLNGEDVSEKIRTVEIDACVAKYAAIKCVRDNVTPMQRKMSELGNIIMEGRDIGTTVFPNADVKIYLNASVEERARRRYKQNIEKGMDVTYEEILNSIIERHKLETEREISPLVKADDAIELDTSNLTIEEVTDKVCEIIESKIK